MDFKHFRKAIKIRRCSCLHYFFEKPWRRFAPLFKTFLEPYHGMIIFDHLFNNFFLVFLILVCLNLVDFVLWTAYVWLRLTLINCLRVAMIYKDLCSISIWNTTHHIMASGDMCTKYFQNIFPSKPPLNVFLSIPPTSYKQIIYFQSRVYKKIWNGIHSMCALIWFHRINFYKSIFTAIFLLSKTLEIERIPFWYYSCI
jgi:hypothetical protein